MELSLNEPGSLNTSDTDKAKVLSAFFTSVCTKRVIQAFMIRESAQRAMNSGSGSCQGLYERTSPTLVLGAIQSVSENASQCHGKTTLHHL